jgi:hypothetical protein
MEVKERLCWPKNLISDLDSFLDKSINDDFFDYDGKNYSTRRNIGYTLQYLESISKQLDSDKFSIHSVVKTHLYKTFIISSVSIIECVLHYFIRANKLNDKEVFEEVKIIKSNEFKILEETYKVENVLFVKKDSFDVEMNLNRLIRIADKKNLFKTDSRAIYNELGGLRKLRNKIHLSIINNRLDHDLNNFDRESYELTKKTLLDVFYSNLFIGSIREKDSYFDFLKESE